MSNPTVPNFIPFDDTKSNINASSITTNGLRANNIITNTETIRSDLIIGGSITHTPFLFQYTGTSVLGNAGVALTGINTLQYDTTGGAYNSSTSTFTCPKPGYYMLYGMYAMLTANSADTINYADISLKIDGVAVLTAVRNAWVKNQFGAQVQCNFPLSLIAGETVQLYGDAPNTTAQANLCTSFFGGYRMY